MAEGWILLKTFEAFETAEADIKAKYTWTTVTEKHFILAGSYWLLYAQGS